MKILVLNSFSLPYFLEEKSSIGNHILVREDILQPSLDSNDYDTFLSKELSRIFIEGNKYDLVVLPYSLSRTNLMEFSGLRLACHVRLTASYGHSGVPFLFMGPSSSDEVSRLDSLGNLLFTPRVFSTTVNTEEEFQPLVETIADLDFSSEVLPDSQYQLFLERIQIEAPSNYGTHHSIANEWAITRWQKMFRWTKSIPEIESSELSSSLYFKWIMERDTIESGKRERFNERTAKTASISGLPSRSRIVYIDDEGNKGWNNILSGLLKNSDAELIPYLGFKKGQTKEELVSDMKNFIDTNPAHCYLIDLRLHEDDFLSDTDTKDLTGHIISRYIKEINKGNQIVVFTASNKTWNYQIANEIGAVGYAIKESPEYNYSRQESYANFCHFASLIRKACNKAYIRDYVEELRKYKPHPLLENFIDMLLLDEEGTIKANGLNLAVFLESYLDGVSSDGKFRLESVGKLKLVSESDQTKNAATFPGNSIIIKNDMSEVIFKKESVLCPSDYKFLKEDARGSISVMMVSLYYYYHISETLCNKVLKLKNDRNRSIAHYHGDDMTITLTDLREIFENVILRILEKDTLSA